MKTVYKKLLAIFLRPHQHHLTHAERRWRLAELLAFFVLLPVIAYQLVNRLQIPLFLIFLPSFVLFLVLLGLDTRFKWRDVLVFRLPKAERLRMIALFALSAGVLYGYLEIWEGDRLFSFVREEPRIWALVMVVYPLISVTTQETIFRVFFFHRYAALFENHHRVLIIANALAFSFAHILFRNWISVILSFLGGLLFATTYYRTQSFWAVVLEHGLYGALIFTLGLGSYFFTGVPNF